MGAERGSAGVRPAERPQTAAARRRPRPVLTIGEARRIYRAAASLPYPGRDLVQSLMLTGPAAARSPVCAGTRSRTKPTEKRSRFRERARKQAPPTMSRCRPRRSKSSPTRPRHRIVGSKFVFSSDGWRSFSNFCALEGHGWTRPSPKRAIRSKIWRLHDFRRTLVSCLAAKPFRYDPVTLICCSAISRRNCRRWRGFTRKKSTSTCAARRSKAGVNI